MARVQDAQLAGASDERILELAVTRSNLELIEARGFGRGQDLQQKLDVLMQNG